MEDTHAQLPLPPPVPQTPPTDDDASPARRSHLLHPRTYTGLLTGLTVTIAHPADIADLSARHLGHTSPAGHYHLPLLDAFLLASLSTLTLNPPLPLPTLLTHCCHHTTHFPARLTTYAHCVARGWTVRDGSKLGVDFLLYGRAGGGGRSGVLHRGRQHSTYAVRVIEQQQRQKCGDAMDAGTDASAASRRSSEAQSSSLQQLTALMRVAQSTKKRVLVSTVTIPADVVWTDGDKAMGALSRLRVELCELSRWSAAVHSG